MTRYENDIYHASALADQAMAAWQARRNYEALRERRLRLEQLRELAEQGLAVSQAPQVTTVVRFAADGQQSLQTTVRPGRVDAKLFDHLVRLGEQLAAASRAEQHALAIWQELDEGSANGKQASRVVESRVVTASQLRLE